MRVKVVHFQSFILWNDERVKSRRISFLPNGPSAPRIIIFARRATRSIRGERGRKRERERFSCGISYVVSKRTQHCIQYTIVFDSFKQNLNEQDCFCSQKLIEVQLDKVNIKRNEIDRQYVEQATIKIRNLKLIS